MAEYGATSNYNLPFPTDEADTDIAGDIKNLALGVDNAIGLNWDTATDEQKAAVGSATAPVRLYGTGRPDGRLLGEDTADGPIIAPIGSTFTCTNINNNSNFGAREWVVRFDGLWIVTAGYTNTNATIDGWRFVLTRWPGLAGIYVWGDSVDAPSVSWTIPGDQKEDYAWWRQNHSLQLFTRQSPGDYVGGYSVSCPLNKITLYKLAESGVPYYSSYKNIREAIPSFPRNEDITVVNGSALHPAKDHADFAYWPSAYPTFAAVYDVPDFEEILRLEEEN